MNITTEYAGEIVTLELLEGEKADDAWIAARSRRLQQAHGVPFYVCLDGNGDVFALVYAASFGK